MICFSCTHLKRQGHIGSDIGSWTEISGACEKCKRDFLGYRKKCVCDYCCQARPQRRVPEDTVGMKRHGTSNSWKEVLGKYTFLHKHQNKMCNQPCCKKSHGTNRHNGNLYQGYRELCKCDHCNHWRGSVMFKVNDRVERIDDGRKTCITFGTHGTITNVYENPSTAYLSWIEVLWDGKTQTNRYADPDSFNKLMKLVMSFKKGDKVERKNDPTYQSVKAGSLGEVIEVDFVHQTIRITWEHNFNCGYSFSEISRLIKLVEDEGLEDSRDELTIDPVIMELNAHLKIVEHRAETNERASIVQQKYIDELKVQITELKESTTYAHQKVNHTHTRLTNLEEVPKVTLPKLVQCIVTKRGPWAVVPHDSKVDGYLPKGMVKVFSGVYGAEAKGIGGVCQYSETVFEASLEPWIKPTPEIVHKVDKPVKFFQAIMGTALIMTLGLALAELFILFGV